LEIVRCLVLFALIRRPTEPSALDNTSAARWMIGIDVATRAESSADERRCHTLGLFDGAVREEVELGLRDINRESPIHNI
jgi:hypothetical protein